MAAGATALATAYSNNARVLAMQILYEAVETGHAGVLGFQRGELLCLHNFTEEAVDLGPVELGPFGYAWLPVEA